MPEGLGVVSHTTVLCRIHVTLVTVSRAQKEEHVKEMAHGVEYLLNVQVCFPETKLLLVLFLRYLQF